MSSVAYIRARAMMRELSLNQTQVVMTAQLNQSMQKVEEKEKRLTALVQDRRFSQELESAFHANRQSSTYAEIHSGILRRFASLNNVEDKPKFNQFFLLDPDGTIQIATNSNWEGVLITDPAVLDNIQNDHASILTYNLVPLYPDQLILLTAIQYRTPSGVTAWNCGWRYRSARTHTNITIRQRAKPNIRDLSLHSTQHLARHGWQIREICCHQILRRTIEGNPAGI